MTYFGCSRPEGLNILKRVLACTATSRWAACYQNLK